MRNMGKGKGGSWSNPRADCARGVFRGLHLPEGQANQEDEVRSRILPPPGGATQQISLRLPMEVVARLEGIAEKSGHTRSDVILYFVQWAIQAYDLEQQALVERRTPDGDGAKRRT